MALATKILRITLLLPSYLVDYGYHFPIDPVIYLYGLILVEIPYFVSPITPTQCLCYSETSEIWLQQQ